jgi:dihydroorotase
MSAILIRGGRLIDPAAGIDAPRDLLLELGIVAAVGAPGELDTAARERHATILDASGRVVAPGFIDIHVHLREPGQAYKETIASGTRAAAAGGFTTVCAMPNTTPVNDSPEITRWMQSPERNAAIRVLPIAAATRGSMGEQLTDYAALKEAGAVAISDDGKPILGDAIMRDALALGARVGLPVIQHAENTDCTHGASMNLGALSFRLGLRGMSVEAESSIVERDIALLATMRDTPAHLHVAHLSTAAALAAVRRAKADGLRVTCEVAPHHFALTEQAVGDYDTHAKMNPPLRSEQDRLALIAGLADGTVDAIATDHAPHAPHEKEQEFERTPNGILGLETALGLSLQILHEKHKVPLARIVELLTSGPARVLNLVQCGSLVKGRPADLVLFSPEEKWTYANSHSLSKNSPFLGWALPGRIDTTIFAGRVLDPAKPAGA